MPALNPSLGEQFGRYRIIKRLGQGGMGSVYLAQDTHLERAVALKVPDFGKHEGPDARRRFLEEARTAATLDHPYLCPVYDAGEIDGQPYLTMAYIEGQSLAALIGDNGWPQRQVAALVGKLALALQQAHMQKVVHRDLKPANIMIKTTGGLREPVIVDFGLARRENPQDQRLTKSGQVMGTLGYMAPEQVRGDLNEIGPACDIYALGVILYELLTGRLPFIGSGLAIAGQILTEAPLSPSTHRGDLDPALEAICLKAMAKKVRDRYGSMAELAADLTGFLQSPSANATPAASVGSPALPSLTSDTRPEPTGSSSLVAHFLAQLAENQSSPSLVPAPAVVASRAPLIERRRTALLKIAPYVVLGVALVAVMTYVTADKGHVENTPKSPSKLRKGNGGRTEAPQVKDVAQIEKKNSTDTDKVARQNPLEKEIPSGAENIAKQDALDKEKPALLPAPPDNGSAPSVVNKVPTPELELEAPRAGFQRLFNGKNLTGWKTDPRERENWHVKNRILVGYGPTMSHLYTKRDDFKDFHLRIEARFNRGGHGGVFFRCPFGAKLPVADPKWPDGFEATINDPQIDNGTTGGLYPGLGNEVFVAWFGQQTRVPAEQWFTLEVIADGNAIAVLVNGIPSGFRIDGDRHLSSGHIALQKFSPETWIEFRTIEIKELNQGNPKNDKEISRFRGSVGRVAQVAFSPDGLRVVWGGVSNQFSRRPGDGSYYSSTPVYSIRWWDLATERNQFAMEGGGLALRTLAISADGQYAASASGSLSNDALLIWDLKSGQRLHRFSEKNMNIDPKCTTVAFSSDDRLVMAALKSGSVLAWDVATEQQRPPVTLKSGPTKADEFPVAAFSHDRRQLVTGRQEGLVELWDLKGGRLLQAFVGHTGVIRNVACSPDGRRILSGGLDRTVRLWNAATGKELRRLKNDSLLRSIVISPDSRRALTADVYGLIRLWDLASGKEVCRMEGHTMGVNSVAFSPDGGRAVSGSDDRTVRLWQLPE